jgi:hypothetical protein
MATQHGCNEVTRDKLPDDFQWGNSGGFYITCKLINNKDMTSVMRSSCDTE